MIVTGSAKQRLTDTLDKGEYLQVGLKGGGCGGATIELTRVGSMSSIALSITGITNVIFADKTSQIYLTEGTLDYVEDILTASFVYKPPLGLESCGCGASIKL